MMKYSFICSIFAGNYPQKKNIETGFIVYSLSFRRRM